MRPEPEDLENQAEYRQLLKLPFEEVAVFVFDQLRKGTGLIVFYWSVCLLFAGSALVIRINLAGHFPLRLFILHSFFGLILFPLVSVLIHEILHIVPFLLTGARKIRMGMDLRQFIFFVSAHRHVVKKGEFFLVALTPFVTVTILLIILILLMPGLWKWSLSLFLLVHSTMCAGDIALMNFYLLHPRKRIFTWDDAEHRVAYFYEEI